MRRALGVALLSLALASAWAAQQSRVSGIVGSKHDFRSTGGAAVRAQDFEQTCTFCHTPHRAQPAVPLWNKSINEGTTYQVYQSSTTAAVVSQPMPSSGSRLCLSCHDGTLALGDTINSGQITFEGVPSDQRLPESRPSNIAGTGLSLAGDHPFAFVPDLRNQQIVNPPAGDPVRLDGNGTLQCSSCHDAHAENNDPVQKMFLVKSNRASALCTACHVLRGGAGAAQWSWSGTQGQPSAHQSSTRRYDIDTNGGVPWLGAHTGYTTVAENGCASCHRAHTAKIEPRLMKGATDQVCFQCHDGNPQTAVANVKAAFGKLYVHPATGQAGTHDPAERPETISGRHAACDDCHNPHAARSDESVVSAPALPGSLLGQSGISDTGAPRDPRRGSGEAEFEYQICFKCHSYSVDKPQVPGYTAYGQLPVRALPSTDMRQAFTAAASFHPVVRPRGLSTGPAGDVPSLLTAPVDASGTPLPGRTLSSSSQIYCGDCHNNDSGRNLGAGYTGAEGVHGSNYAHILERNYVIAAPGGKPRGRTDRVPYSSSNYSLCFKCHSEQSIVRDDSFKRHRQHTRLTSCSTCHDPHGVASGTPAENSALINFDTNIVAPSTGGQLRFVDTGFRSGTCYLMCHGKNHEATTY